MRKTIYVKLQKNISVYYDIWIFWKNVWLYIAKLQKSLSHKICPLPKRKGFIFFFLDLREYQEASTLYITVIIFF